MTRRQPKPELAADPVAARKKAMDYLARREHSQEELRQKLGAAGFEVETTNDAIERLAAEGLQSDRRFVDAFVQSRINQGKGLLRIRSDLGQRGVSDSLLDASIAEAAQDWCALAREVRVRKFGAALPRDFTDKARQMRFLQSRGFEANQIQAAIRAVDD